MTHRNGRYWTDNGGYMSGSAWSPPEGGNGGGTVVKEANFKAVAKGLKEQGLMGAVKSWQLDDWWYDSISTRTHARTHMHTLARTRTLAHTHTRTHAHARLHACMYLIRGCYCGFLT